MDYSVALGDRKCNFPNAGMRQDAHFMLIDLLHCKLNLSSDRLSQLLEQMGESDSGITAQGFTWIEQLLKEAIQCRDAQSVNAICGIPGFNQSESK
jgi:hypothetical protein